MDSAIAPSVSRKSSNTSHKSSHRSTLSLHKTEVIINVYDLLPAGKLANVLWFIGSSLLHSGLVVNGREYAYGGHDRKGVSGVYWTTPKLEPPGGRWKCEVLQGFSFLTEREIEGVVHEASVKFQGTGYNLLTQNCNHFTSYLCEKLTSRQAPAWLNRAAGIGVALPCVVPKEWISPPDHETAEGELLDESDDDADERVGILRAEQSRRDREARHVPSAEQDRWEDEMSSVAERSNSSAASASWHASTDELSPASRTDTSGRTLPASERAPI